MNAVTPMMQQYLDIKAQYKDCILFYRLGDFYEMFFDDALVCSKVLEITLTGKNCGLEERAPMCGIPYHAVDSYLPKMIDAGYKVAICEQVEDPKATKGIVKRDVTRIVTPGTVTNNLVLDESKNNYLMSVVYTTNEIGISVIDVTTGDFYVTQVESLRNVNDEINKFVPSELLCNDAFLISGFDFDELYNRYNVRATALDNWYFDDAKCQDALKQQFKVKALEGLGLKDMPAGMIAGGCCLLYLFETQKVSLIHINKITPYNVSEFMLLDSSTRRNLELTQTLLGKQKRGSLLWVLDKTKTAMGARLLRSFIEQPLINEEQICRRLDAIEEVNDNFISREEIREYLNSIYDLERLLTKISYQSINPRDMIALKNSLSMLPHIKMLCGDFSTPLLKEIYNNIDGLEDIYKLLDESINEEPPISSREGDIIKPGYNSEVDRLRSAKTEGKNWLLDIENQEKENTGIKNLKIKYNKVFGYYLEVTNSYKDLVPDTWTRKQTTTNSERYITPQLKELEDTILGAQDRLYTIEYELFCQVRDNISDKLKRIQNTAHAIALLDVVTNLGLVAQQNNYVKPIINKDNIVDIRQGRHPVVEKMISNDMFVVNDTYLNNKDNQIAIITGPNMAGKSTYMRQTALIVLMAQIGSFVPCEYASVCIADRIFTRVGASDDLASGQSTFMVEMTEVSNILRNATKNSLVILDEIGRGTSTFDGLSIAWSVIEYISNVIGSKTLFATHYHELTQLEGKLTGVNNYCIAVKESGDDIVFLRKIVKGGADRSYGIQVAKLAGVPAKVLDRAKILVEELTNNDLSLKIKDISAEYDFEEETVTEDKNEQTAFATDEQLSVINQLKELNLGKITPLEAINILYEIQEKL